MTAAPSDPPVWHYRLIRGPAPRWSAVVHARLPGRRTVERTGILVRSRDLEPHPREIAAIVAWERRPPTSRRIHAQALLVPDPSLADLVRWTYTRLHDGAWAAAAHGPLDAGADYRGRTVRIHARSGRMHERIALAACPVTPRNPARLVLRLVPDPALDRDIRTRFHEVRRATGP